MIQWLLRTVYPPKCVLCATVLPKNETDFCAFCRVTAPECEKYQFRFSFLAGWTAVWYYKDTVKGSLTRYKFRGRRQYASAYGRKLAMKLQDRGVEFDTLTFVPISPLRKARRGYDQVALLSKAVGRELGIKSCRTLRKIRNTPPQSGITDPAQRRAIILGIFFYFVKIMLLFLRIYLSFVFLSWHRPSRGSLVVQSAIQRASLPIPNSSPSSQTSSSCS